MFKHVAVSIKCLSRKFLDLRNLHRFDCRDLEDIGLDPGDLIARSGRSCRSLKHHPSWDDAGRHRNCAGPAWFC